MEKPKIIIKLDGDKVTKVFTNIRENIDIEVEILYSEQFTSYENLDAEIERKQKGFREIPLSFTKDRERQS